MHRSIASIALVSLAMTGAAVAQSAAPAEAQKGASPRPVGTTEMQQPAGVTRTDSAEGRSGDTAPGVGCQSAGAEMTNGKVETCAE